MILRPFFSYYGAKFNIAGLYPRPLFDDITEPLAGSACYSLRYPDRRVTLCDLDEKVFGVWSYLIGASDADLKALPLDVECVDDLLGLPQEARWLIGFWLGRARQQPARRAGSWMRDHGPRSSKPHKGMWGAAARRRIVAQAPRIRHWRVIHGSYQTCDLGSRCATWFIDPPYAGRAGRRYRHGSTCLDYGALGSWCMARTGQVIVCEQSGADWLPFQELARVNGMRGKGSEVCWLNGGAAVRSQLEWGMMERGRVA